MQLFWIHPCWLPTHINIERPIKASNARMYCSSFISAFRKWQRKPLHSGLEFEFSMYNKGGQKKKTQSLKYCNI